MEKSKTSIHVHEFQNSQEKYFLKYFALLKDCQEIGFYIGGDSNSTTVSECYARHCTWGICIY